MRELTYCATHKTTPMNQGACFLCDRENTIINNPLEWLVDLGRGLARSAEPSTYSYEYRDRAAAYVPMLAAARKAYLRMKNGEPALDVFKSLRTVIQTGIERNHIECAIGILSRKESK